MQNTLRILDILKESREFEEYLQSHENIWAQQSKQQQLARVPGMRSGAAPTPKLAISIDDLGGTQGVQRLRRSTRPEADLKKLVSQAEKNKEFDKAARITDFVNEFSMQRNEISAGLRKSYQDLPSINNTLLPNSTSPTSRQDYLPPLQTTPAAPAQTGSRTIRKNADNSFSLSKTTPTTGSDDIAVPFRDLSYHAGGKSKLGERNPELLQKAQKLQQRVDAIKNLDIEERRKQKEAIEPEVVAMVKAIQARDTEQNGGRSSKVDGGQPSATDGQTAPTRPLPRMLDRDGKTFADFVSDPNQQTRNDDEVDATDILTRDGEQRSDGKTKKGKSNRSFAGTQKQQATGGKSKGSRNTGSVKKGFKKRVVDTDQRRRVNPFSKRTSKDTTLKTQLDLAAKKISTIKKQMKSLIDQLKKEKNPVIKERLIKLLAGLDRQLGAAYVGLQRIKEVSGLTSDAESASFEQMRDLFRETEDLSASTAIQTRKMPEVFKAQKLITDRLGTDALKGLLADDNVAMKKRFASLPQQDSKLEEIDKQMDGASLEEIEDIWAEQDADYDEFQQDLIADIPEKEGESKRNDLTSFATGSEKDALSPKVQRTRDLNSGDQEKVMKVFRDANNEIGDHIKTAKSIVDKKRGELAQSLLSLALIEVMTGESPFASKGENKEPEKVSTKSAYEPLDEKGSDINNMIQSINSVVDNDPSKSVPTIDDAEDLASRFEDFTPRELEPGTQYYALNLLSRQLETMDADGKKELVGSFASERKTLEDKKNLRPYIDRAIQLQKQRPLSMSDEGNNDIYDEINLDNKLQINKVKIIDSDGSEDTRPIRNKFPLEKKYKRGGSQLQAYYQQMLKGKGNKNLPKPEAVVDYLVSWGKGKNPDLPHDFDIDMDAFLDLPNDEELLNAAQFLKPDFFSQQELERLNKAGRRVMARNAARDERKDAQEKSRVKEKQGEGSLSFGEAFDYWYGELIESFYMYRKIIKENAYMSEQRHGDCHKYTKTLLSQCKRLLSTDGLAESLNHFVDVELMDSEKKARYKFALKEFKAKNSYYWLHEQRLWCLEAAKNTRAQLIEMQINPISYRVNRLENLFDSQEFLQSLVEVSREETADTLAINASNKASKQARASELAKNKRHSGAKSRQSSLSEDFKPIKGRRLIDLTSARRTCR